MSNTNVKQFRVNLKKIKKVQSQVSSKTGLSFMLKYKILKKCEKIS